MSGAVQKGVSLPLVKVLDANLIKEGDMVFYKIKGQVRAIARAYRGGLQVHDREKLLGFSEFESYAGSSARRASTYMFLATGETMQSLLFKAASMQPTVVVPPSKKRKLNPAAAPGGARADESDETCAVCCLGGNLLCCEACPAVFHLQCVGLPAMPPANVDWHCPACVCARSGRTNFGNPITPACQVEWVSASKAKCAPTEDLPNTSRPGANSAKVQRDPSWDLHLKTIYESELMPVTGLIVVDQQQQVPPTEDADGSPSSKEKYVVSPLSGRRYLLSTLSPAEMEQVTFGKSVWFPNEQERKVCREMAKLAAAGMQPVLGGPGQGKLSWLLVRGAAVSGTACKGYAPKYTVAQKEALRAVLASARQLLQEAFEPSLDSRTGRDLLPHMLAGGVASNGAMDLSGCYTAVLWRGGCMVAAAVFRVHSAGLAEVPLLATRPQAQNFSYGAKLLKCVEQALFQAGVCTAVVPALVTCEGEASLADATAAARGGDSLVAAKYGGFALPLPASFAERAWVRQEEFQLPAPEERLAALSFPLLRMPSTLLLAKRLGVAPVQVAQAPGPGQASAVALTPLALSEAADNAAHGTANALPGGPAGRILDHLKQTKQPESATNGGRASQRQLPSPSQPSISHPSTSHPLTPQPLISQSISQSSNPRSLTVQQPAGAPGAPPAAVQPATPPAWFSNPVPGGHHVVQHRAAQKQRPPVVRHIPPPQAGAEATPGVLRRILLDPHQGGKRAVLQWQQQMQQQPGRYQALTKGKGGCLTAEQSLDQILPPLPLPPPQTVTIPPQAAPHLVAPQQMPPSQLHLELSPPQQSFLTPSNVYSQQQCQPATNLPPHEEAGNQHPLPVCQQVASPSGRQQAWCAQQDPASLGGAETVVANSSASPPVDVQAQPLQQSHDSPPSQHHDGSGPVAPVPEAPATTAQAQSSAGGLAPGSPVAAGNPMRAVGPAVQISLPVAGQVRQGGPSGTPPPGQILKLAQHGY